ncbi:MAG: hypothetical protein HRU28_15035 [Rhizobiales bacterium]|nr:hypothetical protein [Hyphomicrobiales bacterium]
MRKSTDKDQTNHEWIQTGWKVQATIDVLFSACAQKGIWNALNKVKGHGAWQDDGGNLIYHCGDKLWSLDGAIETGEYQGFVYPTAPQISAPWDEEVNAENSPAHDLLKLFKTWNWARPELDPVLLVGWFASAILGGALDWRPMVFLTGDKASGKSTLQKIAKHLFGDGILQTADTTPAGIYQQVGHGCLPIAIDELENEANNERTTGILKLARLASSGAVMLRGGANHKGTEFACYSCFLFSAILMPPLRAQDRSRMAILSLNTLPQGQKPPAIKKVVFETYGRKLKRRMIDKWPFFKDVLAHYQSEMVKNGHDGRSCDQFGTLIAAAHVLLSDKMPSRALTKKYMAMLSPDILLEISNTNSNSDDCLDYLLQSNIGKWRSGTDKSISALLEMYLDRNETQQYVVPDDVKNGLAAVGMAISKSVELNGTKKIEFLSVAIRHKQTLDMFKDSDWTGKSDTEGGWAQALSRLNGAWPSKSVRVDGLVIKCVQVPLMYVYRKSPDDLEKLMGFEEDFTLKEKRDATESAIAGNREDGIDPFET